MNAYFRYFVVHVQVVWFQNNSYHGIEHELELDQSQHSSKSLDAIKPRLQRRIKPEPVFSSLSSEDTFFDANEKVSDQLIQSMWVHLLF